MKAIEDRFQPVADQIVGGRLSLKSTEHEVVSLFYVLWRLRALHREDPVPDHSVSSVAADHLTDDQREKIEKRGVLVTDARGALPGRMIAGIVIQRDIDRMATQLANARWGVAVATNGEFLVPDDFGATLAVPLTPDLAFIAGCGDLRLQQRGVQEFNRAAIAAARRYIVARDFSRCPK